MRLPLAAIAVLVACDGPAHEASSSLPSYEGDAHELAAKGPVGFDGGLPDWLGRGVCPERRWGVTQSVVDSDGNECTTCTTDELVFEITIENICEDTRELALEDGCLGWLYKIKSETEGATVGKGEGDCDDPGVDSVSLAPGETWTEVVIPSERTFLDGYGEYRFTSTTPVEKSRRLDFEISLDVE